ncbi:MAG: hypothetical protein VX738_03480, partial [Planctomycetota bacterium]|nr:hypothetical protein [Planctomycetota bacterium]
MQPLHYEQLEPGNILAADIALIQNPLDAPWVNNDTQITRSMRRKAFILISLFQLLWIAGCHNSESSSPIESTATITPEKTAAEGRQDA